MTERWVQMLATLRERFSSDTDIVEMESFLAAKGLDRQEIGEVLSLYFADGIAMDQPSVPVTEISGGAPRTSLRVQGPHERGRFTPEAWGYLLTLHESGLVAPFDFEQLVERALFHIDGRIGLSDIRSLADDVGFDSLSLGTDRTLLH